MSPDFELYTQSLNNKYIHDLVKYRHLKKKIKRKGNKTQVWYASRFAAVVDSVQSRFEEL